MGLQDFLFGGSKQETKLPGWYNDLGQAVANRAGAVSNLGFAPWRGPDVAAASPMQQAAWQGAGQAASAFGLPGGGGSYLPQAQSYAGGVQGYSSFPLYQQQLNAFKQAQPDLYNALIGTMKHPGVGPAEANAGGGQGGQGGQGSTPPGPAPVGSQYANGQPTWSNGQWTVPRKGGGTLYWNGTEWKTVMSPDYHNNDQARDRSHSMRGQGGLGGSQQTRPMARPGDLNTSGGYAPGTAPVNQNPLPGILQAVAGGPVGILSALLGRINQGRV